MPRRRLASNVFEAAIARMERLYAEGHRLVVSFSGGKDSTVTLEVCRLAARNAGAGPVEVMVQDEEVAFPGTYEFIEQVAQYPDVRVTWLKVVKPALNIFNRAEPYWWLFDPLLSVSSWVREPPAWATPCADMAIQDLTVPHRFAPPEGRDLMAVIGLRVQESRGRLYGLFSSGGYVTGPNRHGVRNVRPVYDWKDGDVWRAIREHAWPYNRAYDTFLRLGIPTRALRIGPPTMTMAAVDLLRLAARAWPQWFERVCTRLPGVRQVALYGRRAVEPQRRQGETWEATFRRECIAEAAAPWIRERAELLLGKLEGAHRHHSTQPLPEVTPCYSCHGNIGSWRALTMAMYNGDPFSTRQQVIGYVEPEFFRAGAGRWGGTPTW